MTPIKDFDLEKWLKEMPPIYKYKWFRKSIGWWIHCYKEGQWLRSRNQFFRRINKEAGYRVIDY